jgi:hypothetical protein
MENNMLNNKTLSESQTSFDPAAESVTNYLKNDTTMYDNNGKYFDSYLFNAKFNNYIKKENKDRLMSGKLDRHDLDKISNTHINPYELPLDKIIINIKDMWFSMFDKIMDFKNPFLNFDNDEIFYLSISLITISLVYLFFYVIFL